MTEPLVDIPPQNPNVLEASLDVVGGIAADLTRLFMPWLSR